MSTEFGAKIGKVVTIGAQFCGRWQQSKGQSSRLNFQRATGKRSIRSQKAMIE